MAEKMNNLTGSEWLQESFTIWRGIKKTTEERQTKHPALFPQRLPEKLINLYTKKKRQRTRFYITSFNLRCFI